ncbi:kinase-like domain-containing protein [Kickxella alabastrina]|uniref:kinase-like domain-containing protein n=1 Tax=Kickxella alabastrina TaxID=61397 RepID=UPI00222028A0|nr:kinase-like domain-containing protein [Kickxella alabastrina]KAI7834879.1 kinase-like domain-containing protein [Kickxella alabastrina]
MIIRELGRGTHGKVKLAFDTAAGEYFAIKIIDKESRDRRLRPGAAAARAHGNVRIDVDKMEKVKREIAILKKCCHPNVVRLHEVIDDAHARRIYLVIEFMDGGEIAWRDNDGMPKMGAAEARSVFRDLVLGVEYLHYVGVLHRDLKPQNLLCNKAGRVKISDFGIDFKYDEKDEERELAKTAGTPAFFAPEMCCTNEELAKPLPANVITPAIDIWAMGVTLYCLIYGRVPFRATTEFELFNIIPRQQLEFPQLLEASDSPMSKIMPPLDSELHDLLVRMLDKDFRTRITIDEIKHHPWVVRDLAHPSSWAHETDPVHRPSLNVTLQEVEQAVVPKMRQQQDEEQGFRASLRRRISQMHSTATKTKSSLDWLKIW